MICLPTTDIYLRNACKAWIRPWWMPASASRPIRQVAPNAFTCGKWMVLVRRDTPAVMRAALDWRGPLAYLIDDDIAGGAEDQGLPESYRQRLAAFASEYHRPLLTRADVLLVTSDPLAERFTADPAIRAAIRRIEPCWLTPLADQSHFARLAQGEPLRIAHLGTGSHRGALDALTPALTRLLARHKAVELTYVAAPPGSTALAAQPRTQRERQRRWPAYQRWLARQRFHLALYPLLPTAFDRARSANKLLEHAIVGAVGLYPESWQPGRELALGRAGAGSSETAALLAPADPQEWSDALETAVCRQRELAGIAAAASRVLSLRHYCAKQQGLWRDVLGMLVS